MTSLAVSDRLALVPAPGRKHNRAAILEAAHALLRVKGPDSLTMEEIACEARLSRRTIYNHFEDMHALFEQSRHTLLARLAPLAPIFLAAQASPQRALSRFAHKAMRLFDDPCHTDLTLSLLRDGPTHPWLGDAYDAQLIEPMTAALAAYLASQRIPGDPRANATQIVRLLQSFSLSRHLFDRTAIATPLPIEEMLAALLEQPRPSPAFTGKPLAVTDFYRKPTDETRAAAWG